MKELDYAILKEELAKTEAAEKEREAARAAQTTPTAATNAPAAKGGKPDPKAAAKGGKADPKKGAAGPADDPNVPKDIAVEFDLSQVQVEDDFLIMDRSFTHMKHPPAKVKPDPALDKRTVRAQELAQTLTTMRSLPISATVRMRLNYVPDPEPEPVKEEPVTQPPATVSSKGKGKK